MASKKKLRKVIHLLQHSVLGMSAFLQVLDRQRQEALAALAEHDEAKARALLRKF